MAEDPPMPTGRAFVSWQHVLDSFEEPVFVKDRQHRWVAFNDSFCRLLGRPRDVLLGKSDPDFIPPEQAQVFWQQDDLLFESGQCNENQEELTDETGVVHTIWTRKSPIRDDDGEIVGLVAMISDITALRSRLDALAELERRTLAQQEVIDAMEAPMILVWDGILLVPLVGEISERRADALLERLLATVAGNAVRLVFLDVSGVPALSESSAATLLRTVAAARLLGAEAEIVGISPGIAVLLIEQGVDFATVRTHGNLRDGLRVALLRLGMR